MPKLQRREVEVNLEAGKKKENFPAQTSISVSLFQRLREFNMSTARVSEAPTFLNRRVYAAQVLTRSD